MQKLFTTMIFSLVLAFGAYAQEPSGSNPGGQPQLTHVDVNDKVVIAAASFAAKEIQRGSLSKTIFAQKQLQAEGAIYVLTIETVDAHMKHHRYSVQVFMPKDSDKWQVIYFTPADR